MGILSLFYLKIETKKSHLAFIPYRHIFEEKFKLNHLIYQIMKKILVIFVEQ